jgi:transcriptional regulator with XRE-family HTH domain
MAPHPVDVHVGKRLRLRRTILGLSQESLGNAIGVTFQQVQKYERGINRMGSSRLFEFSKLLNIPISYFFEEFTDGNASKAASGFAENKPQEFEAEQLSSRETLEMMRSFYRITDPTVRKRVLDLIRSLADGEEAVSTAKLHGNRKK